MTGNWIKLLLISVTVFLGFSLFSISIFAQGDVALPKYESVNPKDGFRYFIKRFGEKATLFVYTAFPEKKIDYSRQLLDVRLAELVKIVQEKEIANIETASSRYSSLAGQLAGEIVSGGKQNKKEEVLIQFQSHSDVLKKVQVVFDSNTSEWRFVQNNINSLEVYSKQLK